MIYRASLVIFLMLLLAGQAFSSAMLFDFEDASQLSEWHVKFAEHDKVIQSDKFATVGSHSALFTAPMGMADEAMFQCAPPVTDWSEYDRFVIDVFNPSYEAKRWRILLDSGLGSNRRGFEKDYSMPRRGFMRLIIPLSEFSGSVDKSNMRLVRLIFFDTMRLETYVDNVSLLKPGEEPPALPASLGEMVSGYKTMTVSEIDSEYECLRSRLMELNKSGLSLVYRSRLSSVEGNIGELEGTIPAFSGSVIEAEKLFDASLIEAEKGLNLLRRSISESELRSGCERLGIPTRKILVGFAPPTEKLLPLDMPFTLAASREVKISLAKNEEESFQVGVIPQKSRLKNVEIEVTDLIGPDGWVFPAGNIDCDTVGYVKTKEYPPYDVNYIGWWPDPILDFLGPVDVGQGELQSFWVRFHAPKDQKPGVCRGILIVSADGVEPMEFGVEANVRSFSMPDCAPLPIAVTLVLSKLSEEVINSVPRTRDIKYDYADFAGDYYMEIDNLYSCREPDYEVLKYMHDNGKLVSFNFGYYTDDVAGNEKRFRPIYEKVKEMGLIDHAYIYGFDELDPVGFPKLKAASDALKRAFPDVIIMTTARDKSYGFDSGIDSIDAWCPLTPDFKPEKVRKAQENGKYVWWYICCGPRHPFANQFIEYPGIDIRLLMGAMTAKFKTDGFLYYETTVWGKNKPITAGPYTTWEPRSYKTYHGDGSMFCMGPGGRPIPTIRIENYRDGMEDYAYFCILEDIVKKYESSGNLSASQKEWLMKAQAALVVPDGLVHSLIRYSLDPNELYSYRERIAELIESSGMSDADPWGENYGVRGFN